MTLQPLLILGNTEFSVEIADVATAAGWEVAGFVENLERARCSRLLEGLPVYWIDDVAELANTHEALCGLGTTLRSAYVDQARHLGFRFATAVHPTSVVSPKSSLGEGCVLGAGAVVAVHTSLGAHVIANRGALIGHHTQIGDFTTIGPGANVAGSCSIGEGSYVGMGAVVLNQIRIGAHSVIAAGAVVTDDVEDHVMVAGVPARVRKTGIEGK